MTPPVRHAALNVHLWGRAEQNRLLTGCIGPAARALLGAGTLRRFWFDRWDARGPHVAVFLGAPGEAMDAVRAALAERLDAYLAASPSTVYLEAAELEARHAGCRGKQLCSLDALPGLEPNNVWRFAADEPAESYLFRASAGLDADAADRLMADLALWSVDRLRAGSTTGPAVRWIAGLSGAVERAGLEPAELWRFYASTLLPGMRDRIVAGDPEVVAGLPGLVGERNLAAFETLWSAAQAGPPAWDGFAALAELVASARPTTARGRLIFVRELAHSVLGQLDQYVQFRIPLALYAWHRTLPQPHPVPA